MEVKLDIAAATDWFERESFGKAWRQLGNISRGTCREQRQTEDWGAIGRASQVADFFGALDRVSWPILPCEIRNQLHN
eukprot:scaffold255989_cov14-Tisochrysis_lutea.AAC.1